MGEVAAEFQTPLIGTEEPSSPFKRTGTVWTAVAHIITGVVGSGVLSLGWSLAQLGWVAGPAAIVLFASITLTSAYLLCDCYRSPDPEFGPTRNASYHEAVNANLGLGRAWLCNVFVQISLYGIGIAYTITTGISMGAIQKSNCYHKEGHNAACDAGGDYIYMLVFGLIQIALSQIPNLNNIHWLSILAAIMSFTYAAIGLGLGVAKVIGNGFVDGSVTGIATPTLSDKVWLISQGLGDISFSYPFAVILIEIQDTLKAPPPENETMKKACNYSVVLTTVFYLLCGGFGYAAFGDATPGNLLTGFGFYEPFWLVDLANACIVIHLVGGYQVYTQPMFANAERWFANRFPENRFLEENHTVKLPLLPAFNINILRLCFRTAYVISTTVIAVIFPYFNQILGVLGAVQFFPLSIYFPVEMYLKQREIERWTAKWIVLRVFGLVCLFLTLFAFVGSIEGLLTAKLS